MSRNVIIQCDFFMIFLNQNIYIFNHEHLGLDLMIQLPLSAELPLSALLLTEQYEYSSWAGVSLLIAIALILYGWHVAIGKY